MNRTLSKITFGCMVLALLAAACFPNDAAKPVVIDGPTMLEGNYFSSDSYYWPSKADMPQEVQKGLDQHACTKQETGDEIKYTCPGDISWIKDFMR